MELRLVAALILWAAAAGAAGLSIGEEDDFDYSCLPGIKPDIGVILPRGDQHLELGSPSVDIYCRLNPRHEYARRFGADRMGLYLAGESGGPRRMRTTRINDTTVMATYEPGSNMKMDLVSCKVDLGEGQPRGVCQQNIYVGKKPLPPVDFHCISENWSNMNCTWKEPENPIRTTYSLSYIQPGSFGHQVHCPGARRDPDRPAAPARRDVGTCYMDLRTTPSYRQVMRSYQFLMNVTNALDPAGLVLPLPVTSFAVVRPGPATNVTLVSDSPDSLTLHFKIPHELDHFPPGLVFAIRYKSEFDDERVWHDLDTSDFDPHRTEFEIPLRGLLAYVNYTVEVRLLSAKADVSDARLWSDVASSSVRTLPKRPTRSPRVAPGSFEVVGGSLQERKVYLYWERIPETMKNGANFSYVVTEVLEAGNVLPINPASVTSSYAVFPRLSLREHSFFLTSRNEMGTAEDESSYIFLPSHDQLHDIQPRSFTKIAYSDRKFELSWLPPIDERSVSSYTVFWCRSENNRDRPYQCDGQLDWVEVPNNVRIKNVTLATDDVYQFAVAANTRLKRSSGMVWATCTILHDKVVGKLKTVAVDVVDKDAIKVRWRLDCSDRVGIVTGYKISYCPISDYNPTSASPCIGEQMDVVTAPDVEKKWLEDLKPWTYYKVGVAVLTRAGESEISDFLVNRTKSARPGSPPDDLEVFLKGRNRAVLSWEPPKEPNGPIAMYAIRYKYTNFLGRDQILSASTDQHRFTLDNLVFNADYTVAVVACTEVAELSEPVCGKDWAEATVITGIGPSGIMPSPLVTFKNSTEVKIEWGHGFFHKGGPLHHFDIRIVHQALNRSVILTAPGQAESSTVSLAQIGENEDWIPDCSNRSITNLYNFTIRAVTVDRSVNQTYEGEWSPTEVTPAYCTSGPRWAIILPVTIGLVVIVVLAMVYFLKCYKCCHDQICLIWCSICKNMEEEKDEFPYKNKDNLVIAHATQIGSDGKNMARATGGEYVAPLAIDNRKKPDYIRGTSNQSTDKLLPHRNASGSETTSTRSSELDEEQRLADDDDASNRDISHDISNSSIDEGSNIDEDRPNMNNTSGYVTLQSGSSPPSMMMRQQQQQPPYTHMGRGGWQPRAASPPGQQMFFGGGADQLPPGYTKAVQAPVTLADPSRGYVATTFPAGPPAQHELQVGRNLPDVGYVAFENARTGQLPPVGLPNNNNPSHYSSMPPAQNINPNNSGKGYITFTQATKLNCEPQPTLSEPLPEAPVGAYSRVGLGAAQPQQLPDGYVRPGQPQQVLVASNSRPASQMSDKSSRPISLAESEQYRQMEASSLGFVPSGYSLPSPTSPKDLASATGSALSPSSPAQPSYLRMTDPEARDPQDDPDQLVMSPKRLQVETRAPYSKPVTTIQYGKSSMV